MPGATAVDALKRAAAARAAERVPSGAVLGLGTGSTIQHFLELLAERLGSGDLRDVVGVPTSERTGAAATQLGIPIVSLRERPRLDLTVDGADEVDPDGNLIKGLGGALLREKIVAQASDRLVIIADEGKAVDRLGTLAPLPVEVVQFGWTAQVDFIQGLGAEVKRREATDGSPFVTDNGNYILHARFPEGLPGPSSVDAALQARAGVVENGLFLGMTELAFIAGENGVRSIQPGVEAE